MNLLAGVFRYRIDLPGAPTCRHTGPPRNGGRQEKTNKGGHSAGAPPLPIPNREVKPRHADGTAKVGE